MRFVKIDVPTRTGTISGISTNELNIYGDEDSIKAVRRWMHDSESRLPWFEKECSNLSVELLNLRKKLRELGGAEQCAE